MLEEYIKAEEGSSDDERKRDDDDRARDRGLDRTKEDATELVVDPRNLKHRKDRCLWLIVR